MKQQIVVAPLVLTALLMTLACTSGTPTQPTSVTRLTPEPSSSTSGDVTTMATPRNSEQVIFSGVASTDSTFQNGSPVGFWIWCEAESDNPYAGECNGAMYFYALGITKHVTDIEDVTSIEEFGNEQYRIRVQSKDGSINCTLESAAERVNGPRNTVRVECQTPPGNAVSNNAVVNVTGPGE
jgi:hypothetical protein